jgi:thiol-disulfide isomerase/thioredoxin
MLGHGRNGVLNCLLILVIVLGGCRDDTAGKAPAPGPDGRWNAHELERLGADEVLALSGEVKVVALWASWCAPCVEEMPELEAFSSAHPGITVIGLNTDARADDDEVQAVLDRVRPSYPQARLVGGEGRFLERLGLVWDGVLPKTVVIARPDPSDAPSDAPSVAPGEPSTPRVLAPPVTRKTLEAALAPHLEQ